MNKPIQILFFILFLLLTILLIIKVKSFKKVEYYYGLQPGIKAPNFVLSNANGITYSLLDFRKKYANICLIFGVHYDQNTAEFLVKLQNFFYENPLDLIGFVFINVGPIFNSKTFNELENRVKFPLLIDSDGKVSRAYEVKVAPKLGETLDPCIFLIDQTGVISKFYYGIYEDFEKRLLKDIAELR